jgi:hypothetical protein
LQIRHSRFHFQIPNSRFKLKPRFRIPGTQWPSRTGVWIRSATLRIADEILDFGFRGSWNLESGIVCAQLAGFDQPQHSRQSLWRIIQHGLRPRENDRRLRRRAARAEWPVRPGGGAAMRVR